LSNAVFASLSRQQGLMREMQMVANNLANSSTTGYKTDRAIFAEFIAETGPKTDSVSMGTLIGNNLKTDQSTLALTGGPLDLALQGEGFFAVETERGVRLTRAGHFQVSPEGTIINGHGHALLAPGGNPITIPEGSGRVNIGSDGTISANGGVIDQVGVVMPEGELLRDSDTLFTAEGGFAPIENTRIVQGALEQSNVSPVIEMARMIEVQRAYEAGQTILEREDQRISQLITTIRNQ